MTAATQETLNAAVKDAMRAKDKDRLTVLRMTTAALKQIEVDERIELDEARVVAVLEKLIKQRKESAEQFTQAGRDELAAKERAEIAILQEFLPPALSDEELQQIIRDTIAETGAQSGKDMGKVMNALRPRVQGRADMSVLSQQVKALLP